MKMSDRDLPDDSFVFGIKQTGLDGAGAEAVLYEHVKHVPSKATLKNQDIVKCNKLATQSGAITSKDQRDFQKSHRDVKQIMKGTKKEPHPVLSLPEGHRFGQAAYLDENFKPPAHSVNDVIEGRYYTPYHPGADEYPTLENKSSKGKMPLPRGTRANTLRQGKNTAQPEVPERFVMARFRNVPSKLQLNK